MRVAFIGVSHWHTAFYLEPIQEMKDVRVVGVCDPDPEHATRIAAKAKCPMFVDYRDMCLHLKPDFVIALGKHSDMAEEARFLIDARIPFAIEKPAAINLADARDIAARAAAAGVFAAVPFPMRYSPMIDTVREIAAGEAIRYVKFNFMGGVLDRYRAWGTEWKLRRETAGGGPLIGLGVHVVDQCIQLLPDAELQVVAAAMSNNIGGLDIEDHAVMVMRGGAATCMVEAAYFCPGKFDLQYSIRTDGHYFIGRDSQTLEIRDNKGNVEIRQIPLLAAKGLYYPEFLADTLARVADGRPPKSNLADMAAVNALIQTAYSMSPIEPGI